MPRPQTVHDEQLLMRLAEVFRVAGFEGASLGALAEASQLRRASLYHRFPDGKAQMAEAVLEHVQTLFVEALEPMRSEPDVVEGIVVSAARIGEIYGGGLLPCVLDTLTLSGAPESVRAIATRLAALWVDAMAAAAVRAGRPPESARAAAQDAFVRIEGGLVFARIFGDPSAFRRTLDQLPSILAAGAAS